MNNFKFFIGNKVSDELSDLVHKWEPTGLLENSLVPELVAVVMETTINYLSPEEQHTYIYITLSQIFRNKQRFYSLERIRSLVNEILRVSVINQYNFNDFPHLIDYESELCQFLVDEFNWEE